MWGVDDWVWDSAFGWVADESYTFAHYTDGRSILSANASNVNERQLNDDVDDVRVKHPQIDHSSHDLRL